MRVCTVCLYVCMCQLVWQCAKGYFCVVFFGVCVSTSFFCATVVCGELPGCAQTLTMSGVTSGEVTGVILSCVAIGFMVAVYYALQVRAGALRCGLRCPASVRGG